MLGAAGFAWGEQATKWRPFDGTRSAKSRLRRHRIAVYHRDSMPNASERKQILTNLDQVQQVPKPPAPEPGHEPGNIPPPPPSEIPVPDPAPPPIENPGDVPLPPITDPDVTDSLPSPSCRPASSQQLWMARHPRISRSPVLPRPCPIPGLSKSRGLGSPRSSGIDPSGINQGGNQRHHARKYT